MNTQYRIGLDLLILVLSVFLCLSISSFAIAYLPSLFHSTNGDLSPDTYLVSAFITQVGGFFGGFLLYLKLSQQSFKSIITINTPNLKTTGLLLIIFLACLPVMTLLTYVNSFLKEIIPYNTFILEEEKILLAQNVLLQNTGVLRLALKLVMVAFLPAVAEELIFRGVLLTKIKKASGNEHYAVVVTAILFAAIHFQPSHLLPMIFLAIVIGYSYTRTSNIFYAMLFHFMFNATTILSSHFFGSL